YRASLASVHSYVLFFHPMKASDLPSCLELSCFFSRSVASIPAVPGSTSPGTTSQASEPTLSSSTVTLSWNASSGATSYEVAVKRSEERRVGNERISTRSRYQAYNAAGNPYAWTGDAMN